jgi:uncharacterized protein YacL
MGLLFSICFGLALAFLGLTMSNWYLGQPWWADAGSAIDVIRTLYHLAFWILGFLVGFIVAGVLFRQVVALGSSLRRVPAQDKAAGVIGIIIGLTLTALLSILFYYTKMPYAPFVVLLLAVPCIYLGGTIALSMKEELFYFFPGLGAGRPEAAAATPPRWD